MEATKPQVKKAKKKQVKDELDRIKQAEKKKRRLEKALATSAAIRSELEKKKQTKKEEQQRLDEEGAAIAEAVALQVLIGEDLDDSTDTIANGDFDAYNPWYCARNINLLTDSSRLRSAHSYEDLTRCSYQSNGIPSAFSYDSRWNCFGDSDSLSSSSSLERSLHWLGMQDAGHGYTDISAGCIAAEAVSSLQIGENDGFDAVFFNGF